jgi:hypothetical protein
MKPISLGACVLALLVAAVGATEVVQAKSGKASTAAKKCKKKHRKKCRKAAPPTTFVPPSTTTGTNPTTIPSTPPAPHTLTVGAPANGSVTSSPAGIDCPGDCSETYDPTQVVTLTPHPDLHHVLNQWGGDCSGGGGCQVTMDADRSVTAAFALEMHTLNVFVTSALVPSSDGGRVSSDTGGINCRESGGTCSAQYPYGTVVTLTETPDPAPWMFVGWSGGTCSGIMSTCQVTMTGSPTVFADFADT